MPLIGKTGRIFNATKPAVGILINKRLRTRFLPKGIRASKCRQDFLDRVKSNAGRKSGLEFVLSSSSLSQKRLSEVALLVDELSSGPKA